MRLITKLTAASVSARERHNESYARKLACTSSSRLADIARVALSCTIQPITANSNVSAMDVDSRIFHSNDKRENEANITFSPDKSLDLPSPADTRGHIYSCAGSKDIRLRKSSGPPSWLRRAPRLPCAAALLT